MSFEFLNIKNKSSYILFLVISVYFLDFITGYKLSHIFILNTNETTNYNNLWSLLTYPLKFTSFASLLIFMFAMGIISKKLERVYKSNIIPFVYLLIVLCHSTLFTLIYSNSKQFVSGTDGLSFFIITLYFLLNKNQRLTIASFVFNVNKVVIGAIISLWVFAQLLNYYAYEENFVLNSFFLAGFGTLNALVVYFQIYLIKKLKSKRKVVAQQREKVFDELEHSHSYSKFSESNMRVNQVKYKNEEPNIFTGNSYSDEEKMNDILDKINSFGYDSLTFTEQNFLKEYSKRI